MPRIPATVVSTLSVRRIRAKLVALTVGLICTQFLQACTDGYESRFEGYDRATLDSLVLPGRFVGDTSGSTFHLWDFTVASIGRPEKDDPSENRGSGGFTTWMQRNRWWYIRLIPESTAPRWSIALDLAVDSINPYKSDPKRGIVVAHLGTGYRGDYTELVGTIESSIAMDEIIVDHKPFTFTMSLRDTSGLSIVLTDSVLLWTEYREIPLSIGGL
jgi:hypothetical protein